MYWWYCLFFLNKRDYRCYQRYNVLDCARKRLLQCKVFNPAWLDGYSSSSRPCLPELSPNRDETRSKSVARTAVDGRLFSLVLMQKYNWKCVRKIYLKICFRQMSTVNENEKLDFLDVNHVIKKKWFLCKNIFKYYGWKSWFCKWKIL